MLSFTVIRATVMTGSASGKSPSSCRAANKDDFHYLFLNRKLFVRLFGYFAFFMAVPLLVGKYVAV